MFEHRVTVTKRALRGPQAEVLPGFQVNRIQRFKAVLQLDTVGADVLHRGGAHRARDEGQVFQAIKTLRHGPGHEVVPHLAGTGFDHPGARGFFHKPPAHDLGLEHQGFDVAGQHDVAAATQHEFRHRAQRSVGQHLVELRLAAHPHQLVRACHDAKGVQGLEGNIFLD